MPAILTNRALTDAEIGGATSTVGEPSIAKRGDEILMTGNWYAARSSDGGNTWNLRNPSTFFPAAAGGFCCDQTALFDPASGLTFWLLQYDTTAASGTNVLRLAVNRTGNMADGNWIRWDFSPPTTNSAWANEWFDYNHIAVSDTFLYIVSNAFTFNTNPALQRFTRCVVLRIPLAQLAAGSNINYGYFNVTENGSLRLVQGARGTMYFADHVGLDKIRVWAWPDNATQITHWDLGIAAWSPCYPGSPQTATAPSSDGTDWIRRADSRITAGWCAQGEIGFAWTANTRQNRPFPYARFVRIKEGSPPTVVANGDIWHGSYAWAYPNVSVNNAGELGMSIFRGGGTLMPGHVVGVFNRSTGGWQLVITRDGTNGPTANTWGDYLTCHKDSTNPAHWIATGYTLEGGQTRDSIVPRYVRFSV